MRKIQIAIFAIIGIVALASCSNSETYADQKKKERTAINKLIADSTINVISENTFNAQDSTTDVSKNQYVLFESSGVYMQIIRKGCGEKIKDGETVTVLCRFNEYNLLQSADSVQLSNMGTSWLVDKIMVKRNSGTYTASFDKNSSLMYTAYSSAAVPNGWLIPLSYINIGRPTKDGDEIAKVKLIVPHSQGQQYASQNVYPCLYELTFQRGK